MIYYAIFYFIRKYFYECLHIVFVIALVVSLISYVIILDLNHSVMYAAVPYMRIYYFLFMLMGAIVAIKKKTGVTPGRAAVYAVLNLVLYYVCMGIYKVDPFFCKFQIVSLFPLLFAIYWVYRFCDTSAITKIFQTRCGSVIYFISSLTLEIYMVQYAFFTDALNFIFPFNIIIVYLFIFLAAYILKCLSQVFSQIFNDNKFCIEKVYKV